MDSSFQRIDEGINVHSLLQEISDNKLLFKSLTARQDLPGSPHSDTETIYLRWSKDQSVEAAFTDLEAVDYPAFNSLPSAREIIARIARVAKASELGRAIIVKLRAGGVIDPHIDEGEYADKFERFHLCLKSEEGNIFFSEHMPGYGEWVHMRPGELWTFNHKRKHWLFNNSKTDRVHLILDAVAPKFRKDRE